MSDKQQVATERGRFVRDRAGMWHYNHEMAGSVDQAIHDALKHRPIGGAWFWFNGVVAPIEEDDTVDYLFKRWNKWRNTHQMRHRGGEMCLLYHLDSMRKEGL